MNIRRLVIMSAFVAIVAAGIIAVVHKSQGPTTDRLTVSTSFYPLYEFAKQIGGQHVSVQNVTPAGAEPHEYEPSPKTLVQAQKSKVFIYNGGTFEPWAEKFLKDYNNVSIKSSSGISLLASHQEDGHDEDHGHTAQDPHFWLDPVLAQTMVRTIRDGLIKADPEHAADYRKNAAAYNKQLAQLNTAFTTQLADCQIDTVITAHQALSYVAARYNFDVAAISGVSPDQEPSPAALASLSDLARQKHITYIFFESLVSPRLADTIAQEVQAKTLVFDPLEGLTNEDQQSGKNYLSVQRENLANLRTALACR